MVIDWMLGREGTRTGSSQPDANDGFVFLFLIGLAFLPYANSLFGGFVYDDYFQVIQNPYVHSFRYLREIFTTTVWSFQGAAGVSNYYRPLMTLGYLLCYQIAGPVQFLFHLVSVILHVLVVLLIFSILRRLSGERIALIAAGLFALHPIHTESVAWIAGVTDLELAVFYLLTFLLYLRLADENSGIGLRIAMCTSFVLALLSKEQAMTLPFVLTVFEHFYRDDRATTSLRQKVSRYAPLWIIATIYMIARGMLLGGIAAVTLHPNLTWYQTVLTAISLTGRYIWKLLWPAYLSNFYVFHPSIHLREPGVLLGLLALLLCGIAFVALWRRAHILSFALFWIFVTLGPVLNARWMPASVFAERYLYLPSIGFCWIVGWAAAKFWSADLSPGFRLVSRPASEAVSRAVSRAVPVLLAILAFSYASATIARNRDWRSEESLFRVTLATQPGAATILANLGVLYFNEGDMARAEHECLASLYVDSSNIFALNTFALIRQRQHRYNESLDFSWRTVRLRPQFTMAHVNLAETLAMMGRAAEADWQFRIATALSPLSVQVHNDYGAFLLESKRLESARSEYERSVEADPNWEAYDHLGDIYAGSQEHAQAQQAFRNALRLNPYDAHAHFGLGQELQAAGKPADALAEIESGLGLDPANPTGKAAEASLRGNATPTTSADPH